MSVKTEVLIKDEKMEFVRFSYAISIVEIIQTPQIMSVIDNALNLAINNYVGNKMHNQYSDHTDKLSRSLIRLVVIYNS